MTEINLVHTRWDTFTLPITVKAGWVAMDLTWATLKFSIRVSVENLSEAVVYTCPWTLVDAVNWKAKIAISYTNMDSIAMDEYFYDVEMIDSVGDKLTILKWKLTIKYDVTRE